MGKHRSFEPMTIRSVLDSTQHCVITTHINPDGDAIGSAAALWGALTERGVHATVLLPGPMPENLRWVPGAEHMEVYHPSTLGHDRLLAQADTIFVLDLNTLKRLDLLGEAIGKAAGRKVMIDHHIKPDDFADVVMSDVEAPSTCSMLYDVLADWAGNAVPRFSTNVAQALYVGIMTDTGNFRFPRTDARVHVAVAELLDCGADNVKSYELIYNTSTFGRLRLLGNALASLTAYCNGKLCIMALTVDEIHAQECTLDDTEGFVHHTLSVDGVKMGLLVIQLPDMVKLSFRSKGTTYVRDLAAVYGGGGHVYAAGARVRDGVMATVIQDVVQRADTMFA